VSGKTGGGRRLLNEKQLPRENRVVLIATTQQEIRVMYKGYSTERKRKRKTKH
jgi:hypothetical protein